MNSYFPRPLLILLAVGLAPTGLAGEETSQSACLYELPSQSARAPAADVTPIQYERLVEIRTPGGSLCPATVKLFCGAEQKGEGRLPTGEGKLSWHHPCPDATLEACCTGGASAGHCGRGGMPEGDPLNFDNWVLYTGNHPDLPDGTLQLTIQPSLEGTRAAIIEIKEAGTNKIVGFARTLTGSASFSLDSGRYEIKVATLLSGRLANDRATVRAGQTVVRSIEWAPSAEVAGTETPPPPDINLEGKRYPQLDLQLCDSDNHPLSLSGEVIIEGVDRPHLSLQLVRNGRFEVFGLTRGEYQLTFIGPALEVHRRFTIPVSLYVPGKPPGMSSH